MHTAVGIIFLGLGDVDEDVVRIKWKGGTWRKVEININNTKDKEEEGSQFSPIVQEQAGSSMISRPD